MSEPSDIARSDRPNLEQKRKLAKELLKAVKRLDDRNAARFTWNHPRFKGKSGRDVIREGVSLSEAQHVVARESGFESWPKLIDYIRVLENEPDGLVAVFEDAVRAVIRGDTNTLRALLNEHPDVASMRSTRHHQCVLPHYVAANGVENEHQIVPPNAVEIARILFAAGADQVVDATTNAYGGGPGSTPLIALVTSGHPHVAGVQADLVRVFCDAGANPNGIDDDAMPMAMALGFRYPQAAQALADCGARIDNLPAAAALGRDDLVKTFLDESGTAVSQACVFPNPGNEPFPQSVAPHPAKTIQQALVFACMCGHVHIAKQLLEHGVDVNAGPRQGVTALHECCYQGQAEAAHLLLEHGADPTLRDGMWNSTAIGWANASQQTDLVSWLFDQEQVAIQDAIELQRYDVARRMLESDSQLANAPNGGGGALRHAAFKGDIRMVQLLLEFRANPWLHDGNGHSALDFAEKSGHQEIVVLLRNVVATSGEQQSKENPNAE